MRTLAPVVLFLLATLSHFAQSEPHASTKRTESSRLANRRCRSIPRQAASFATVGSARTRYRDYGRSGEREAKLATTADPPTHRFLTLPNNERQNTKAAIGSAHFTCQMALIASPTKAISER